VPSRDKGKPTARWGRKAKGLLAETARLPKVKVSRVLSSTFMSTPVTASGHVDSQLLACVSGRAVSYSGTPRSRTRVFGILLVAAALCAACVFGNVHTAFAFAQGQPLDTGFPRLGAYFPATTTAADQTNAARFDWICLGDSQQSAIAGLKSINRDLIVLRRTDACEEGVGTDGVLSQLPASWILTQVGTTLAGNVDTVTQSIPVTALTNGSLQLFAVGEYALIGQEVCTITDIRTNPNRLIVTRGTVYPAVSHSTGERVAAAVSAFPGTVTMDLTDQCPSVDLGDGNGLQTWLTWRIRDSLADVSDPAWDGIYMDVSDGQKSSVVDASSSIHSVDYQRTNMPVTDGYAAFDSVWDTGIQALDNGIVAGLGGRIYFTNGPFPDYRLRNGTTFEDFPSNSWDWQSTIFGPRDPGNGNLQGSVRDWMNKAAEPNLTTFLVYPTPHNSSNTPNYQLMRYGLCSALISGTYFCYQVPKDLPPDAASVNDFPWFDEYNGGGKGPHYLGQPLGAAYLVQTPGPELLTNSEMDSASDVAAWSLYAGSPVVATKSYDGTGCEVSVTSAYAPDWNAYLYKSVTGLVAGTAYTVSFDMKSSVPMDVVAELNNSNGAALVHPVATGSGWTTYEGSGVAVGSPTQLRLYLGRQTGNLWVKNISLKTGSRDVWRRDFQNGVALVNASGQTASIALGSTYQKIKGTQDPVVNDGTLVSAVTVPAKDGVILLRSTIAPPVAYTLTYSAGSNGTITGSVLQSVDSGASGTAVAAVANSGYHFLNWSDGVTSATRTDTNITTNLGVSANFAINAVVTSTLTYSAGSNGTITGSLAQSVNSGASGTAVTAVASRGYRFVNWSDGSTSATRTDTNITANKSVTANFASTPLTTYTLTYSAGSNGTITGSLAQSVDSGASGTAVTATPASGYHFLNWSDGSTSATRTDTNITANKSVTANFASTPLTTYTLTYSAGSNGTITGSLAQSVDSGASGTGVTAAPASGTGGTIVGASPQTVAAGGDGAQVTAVPSTGYRFVGWSDGVTTAARADTSVNADINVTATFAPAPVATKLTMNVSPTRLSLGHSAHFYGVMAPNMPNGTPIALLVRKAGQTKWTRVGSYVRTYSAHHWSRYYHPNTRGTYYFKVRFSATATYAGSTSRTVTVVWR